MRENQLGATQHCDHLCIHSKIIDSAAWCSLSYASQSLYVLLRRKLLESNNGNISATLGDLKHYGWKSSSTLAKALKELKERGLIAVTRQGGIAFGQKVCTLYRFTDVAVYEHPKLGIASMAATNDWKRFATSRSGHQSSTRGTVARSATVRGVTN